MKRIFVIAVLLLASLGLYAQTQDDITLVVSGQGSTKEEATANALRSAIEQAYGVFVSANTQILNDDVVKDEIATVASGNVKSYEELSCMTMADGSMSVTLSATVSISNLITYAKSHGSSAEFAGQTFAMNMKMRKLNTENEYKALLALKEQVAMLARHCFDYEIEKVNEPTVTWLSNQFYIGDIHINERNHIFNNGYFEYLPAKSDFYWDSNNVLCGNIDKLEQMGIRYINIDGDECYYEYEGRGGTKIESHGYITKFDNGDIYCELYPTKKIKLPDLYSVKLKIKIVPNDNYKKVDSVISKTLGILSLSQEEQEAWHRSNMKTHIAYWNIDDLWADVDRSNRYVFRNSHSGDILRTIMDIFNIATYSWILDVKGLDFYFPNVQRMYKNRIYCCILFCGRHDIKEIYFPPYFVGECYEYSSYTYEKIREISQIVEFHFFEPSLCSVQGFDIKFYPELYEQGLRIINNKREK